MQNPLLKRSLAVLAIAIVVFWLPRASAQAAGGSVDASAADADKPVVITLDEAIRRAQAIDAGYAAAMAAGRTAVLDRDIAVAGLLPTVRLYNQDIYTQPNGLYAEGGEGVNSPDPKFVSNDARPREYIAQGMVDETLGLAGPAALRHANATAAQAAAEQEIARRGLVSAVTVLFYTSYADDRKLDVAQAADKESSAFVKITEDREKVREAAHADVIKAQILGLQTARDLSDAKVAAEKARLELGVLLFPDPTTPYTLKVPEAPPALASREDIHAAAAKNNPELKSALAALSVSSADVLAARAAYLPDLRLNVTYGIDANEFAVNGPLTPGGAQANNLGYSTIATVNIPVWDWLAAQHKVKQSKIRRQLAQVVLTNTQRKLIAQLDEAYSEAAAAQDQLASLDSSVTAAAESLRLLKMAYQNGDATVLEVVDAQTAYTTARNAQGNGLVRYETALAALETLTGTM